MKREGYTITDCADYYDFRNKKWSSRNGKKITRIIPHHMAGNLNMAQFTTIMNSNRQMSPSVSVHTDGTVVAWVPEEMRPWTTGSQEADGCALTLEIANDTLAPNWHVSDKAYKTAVKIMAEWCIRYNIDPVYTKKGNGINMHKDWAATACPGSYLEKQIKSGQLEKDIRAEMLKKINPNAKIFVEEAYKNVLGRKADASGLAYWATSIAFGKLKCKDVLYDLFTSKEYLNKKKSDIDFVMDCYRGYLQRAHDFNGFTYWCKKLDEGKTRNQVLNSFGNNKEFKNLVARYKLQ